MALKPVARRLVPENVFDQLLGEVVDGELAAGDSLPSERRLAEGLGVARPPGREAPQRARPGSAGWPGCWACPVQPCGKPSSGSPRRDWSRYGTAAARRCSTSAPRPGW